jgi:hypothetical protein
VQAIKDSERGPYVLPPQQQEEGGPDVSSRIFINPKGNWEETEKATKDVMRCAVEIEEIIRLLVEKTDRLDELVLKAHGWAPKTDCLFYDSPLSPTRTILYMKSMLSKMGWAGVAGVTDDPRKIPDFADIMKLSCKWLLKFNKPIPNKEVK